MKKRRLIPVLLLRNGWLVQSKQFRRWQNLGNPITAVKRLSEWASDELIYLDISRDDSHDMRRDDLGTPNRTSIFEIIEDVSKAAFMPITVGGRVRTLADIEKRLALGADKVAINSKAVEDPDFITKAANEFGAQCVVVSIDYKKTEDGMRVATGWGRELTEFDPVTWARQVQERGAGEVLINSIDRDGMRNGYDLETIAAVSDATTIPVIACGGVGEWEHLAEGLEKTSADAVAAANIFHYSDQSVFLAKKHLTARNLDVRAADLFTI